MACLLVLFMVLVPGLSASIVWNLERVEAANLTRDTTIHAIHFDSRHGLWLAIDSGLLRYDGRKSRLFSPFMHSFDETGGLRLFTDRQGDAWLWSPSGRVKVFRNGRWQSWAMSQKADSGGIAHMGRGQGGDLLMIGHENLVVLGAAGEETNPLPKELQPGRLRAVHRSGDGTTWFCEPHRVLATRPKQGVRVLLDAPEELTASCLGLEGDLFVATGKGLLRISLKEKPVRVPIDGEWGDGVTAMAVSRDGRRIWIGTQGDGLWVMETRARSVVRCDLPLDPLFITDLVEDGTDGVWLATAGSGLLRVTPAPVPLTLLPAALSGSCLFLDADGDYRAALPGELWRFTRGQSRFEKEPGSGLALPRFWLVGIDGVKWLVGDDGFLLFPAYESTPIRQTWPADMSAFGAILAGAVGTDGDLWLSCSGGLLRLDGSGRVTKGAWPLEAAEKSSLAISGGSAVWLQRNGQLFLLRDGGAPLPAAHGTYQRGWGDLLGSGKERPVFGLHEAAGPGRLTPEQWVPLSLDPEFLPLVTGMKLNARNELWFSQERGLVVCPIEGLVLDAKRGLPPPLRWVSLGKKPETWGFGAARDEWVWWLEDRELYEAQTRPHAQAEPIQVSLDRLYLNGREVLPLDESTWTMKTGDVLQVQVWVPQVDQPHRVSVRYRIEGTDGGWAPLVSAGDRLMIAGLGPGSYHLDLAVNAGDGHWQINRKLTVWNVAGEGPDSRWLLLGGGLLFGGLLAGVLRRALRRKRGETGANDSEPAAAAKYSTSGLSPERAEEIKRQLLTRMSADRPYLQASLTLRRLADQMGIHYNHLSQVINDKIGQSAKEFINQYRVEAAAQRLADPDEQSSIIDIAFECGFYSKSVFNAAFKRVYDTTPSMYREARRRRP